MARRIASHDDRVREGLGRGRVPGDSRRVGRPVLTLLSGPLRASSRPVARATARMGQREHHDLLAGDLVWHRERKTIEHRDSSIDAILPARCCFGKLKDQREYCVDLVFELGAETGLSRLVVVDLMIDLEDRETM